MRTLTTRTQQSERLHHEIKSLSEPVGVSWRFRLETDFHCWSETEGTYIYIRDLTINYTFVVPFSRVVCIVSAFIRRYRLE